MSRMKFKLIEILKATSFNDWKSLSGRDNGMEEQIEGDLLRASGNLAGRSAGFVLKRLGQGLGGGVSLAASGFGDEIQRKSEIVGAGAVGATVNSLVTGLGGGVGNTVQGVGTGSGKLLRGGAQGIGQIVGGGKLTNYEWIFVIFFYILMNDFSFSWRRFNFSFQRYR